MHKTETQKELSAYAPIFCCNCGLAFDGKYTDVKELPPENAEQVRWYTFCGYCGAIYTVEIEP